MAQLGEGIVDQEMAGVIAQLPHYTHRFALANLQRVWARMAAGENLCCASAFKTAGREQFACFVPASITTVSLRHMLHGANGLGDGIDAGRISYAMEYTMTIEYQNWRSYFKHSLQSISLTDAAPLAIRYIACTRNDWGKKVVTDLHNAIRLAAAQPVYRNTVRCWLSPSLARQYGPQMDAFYDKLVKGEGSTLASPSVS